MPLKKGNRPNPEGARAQITSARAAGGPAAGKANRKPMPSPAKVRQRRIGSPTRSRIASRRRGPGNA